MSGWVLTGHDGSECLTWRDDLIMPQPGPGAVPIRMRSSSGDDTGINTRIG